MKTISKLFINANSKLLKLVLVLVMFFSLGDISCKKIQDYNFLSLEVLADELEDNFGLKAGELLCKDCPFFFKDYCVVINLSYKTYCYNNQATIFELVSIEASKVLRSLKRRGVLSTIEYIPGKNSLEDWGIVTVIIDKRIKFDINFRMVKVYDFHVFLINKILEKLVQEKGVKNKKIYSMKEIKNLIKAVKELESIPATYDNGVYTPAYNKALPKFNNVLESFRKSNTTSFNFAYFIAKHIFDKRAFDEIGERYFRMTFLQFGKGMNQLRVKGAQVKESPIIYDLIKNYDLLYNN